MDWKLSLRADAMPMADGHLHAGVLNPPGIHLKPDPPAYPNMNCSYPFQVWTTNSQLVDDFGMKLSGKVAADYPAFRHRLIGIATRYKAHSP